MSAISLDQLQFRKIIISWKTIKPIQLQSDKHFIEFARTETTHKEIITIVLFENQAIRMKFRTDKHISLILGIIP